MNTMYRCCYTNNFIGQVPRLTQLVIAPGYSKPAILASTKSRLYMATSSVIAV